ncbi:MaoC family dehydratase N-terminal domain-containing protein [Rhodanobacter sp. Si-c]|uniref:MaoC family dehydratase N-terminal domain-containing protein n=1 Tax=Rhodanobacter lycopersici TaxID=3162487 RepID=A0ABV3QJ21_9GAMM
MIDKKWMGYELPVSTLPLERGRLRAFARAVGEPDPVYVDVEAARAAGYPDLPAPPTFLFAAELDSGTQMAMAEAMGISLAKLLHGEQGFTYHRPACAGDTVTVRTRISEIYDKKGGALEFVVTLSEVRNQHDDLVAELRNVLVCRH